MLLLCLSVINAHDIAQIRIIEKRELSDKDEHAAKDEKIIMLTVKLELNVSGVIEEIVDHVNSAAISETK